ncbi:MAG: cation diffusion facilitator family transporter [Actinomycetota bacterium]
MREVHDHGTDLQDAQRRALWISLGINAVYMVVEVIGGIEFNSLALLADAGHMLSDVGGLGIALIAQSLVSRPASARHTFGLQRAEVLGALANGVGLVAVVGWIALEAIRRLMDPEPVAGRGLLLVAAFGLAINLWSAVLLARSRGRSLNMKAAFLHMVADAAGSVAVIAAAIAVIGWNANWLDPIASLAIGALILWATWGLLRETVHVLMEGAPRCLRAQEVETALASQEEVESVHHLHLWTLASDVPALSAHVVISGEVSLHDAQSRGDEVKRMLLDRFGIEHATLELECHPCEPTERVTARESS